MCGLVLNQSRMTAERDNEPVADWGTVTPENGCHIVPEVLGSC
jgi:hypothetical protein